MAVSNEELAYIAGFLDGEGCISLDKNTSSQSSVPCFGCRVGITNTNLEILEWIQSKVGGYIVKRKREKANWKISYHLMFRSKETLRLLSLLFPYLKVKRKQAELILAYRKSFPIGFRYRKYGDEMVQLCYYYHNKKLNKKGYDSVSI